MSSYVLSGKNAPLTEFRPLSAETGQLLAQLAEQVRRSPGFFTHCLVQLDLSALGESQDSLDLPALVLGLRELGLVPALLKDGSAAQCEIARSLGLGLAGTQRGAPKQEERGVTVQQGGLRSGQKAYARGGDLVILGPVNSGAEALADGSVHVYGPLRGRAMAGVTGDTRARIFCRALHAELLSVAGLYKTSESMDEQLQGRSIQVYLEGERLVMEPIP